MLAFACCTHPHVEKQDRFKSDWLAIVCFALSIATPHRSRFTTTQAAHCGHANGLSCSWGNGNRWLKMHRRKKSWKPSAEEDHADSDYEQSGASTQTFYPVNRTRSAGLRVAQRSPFWNALQTRNFTPNSLSASGTGISPQKPRARSTRSPLETS